MKIGTLRNPIKHERKPEYDEQRFAALDAAFSELCPIAETAEAMIDTLRMMNHDTKEVIVVGHVCLLEIGDIVKEVDIAGFTFADLFTTMIAEVIRK